MDSLFEVEVERTRVCIVRVDPFPLVADRELLIEHVLSPRRPGKALETGWYRDVQGCTGKRKIGRSDIDVCVDKKTWTWLA